MIINKWHQRNKISIITGTNHKWQHKQDGNDSMSNGSFKIISQVKKSRKKKYNANTCA